MRLKYTLKVSDLTNRFLSLILYKQFYCLENLWIFINTRVTKIR